MLKIICFQNIRKKGSTELATILLADSMQKEFDKSNLHRKNFWDPLQGKIKDSTVGI